MNVHPNFSAIQFSFAALVSGLVMLTAGGEFLVSGSVKLAKRWGMAPVLIGLTVVAFGTSTPELFVSLIANLQGHSDIMIGNVIGSNIANIGLILGISAIIVPLEVKYTAVRIELYLVLASTALTGLIAWHGIFPRSLGIVFVSGLALYTFFSYRYAIRKKHSRRAISEPSPSRADADNPLTAETSSYFLTSCLILGGLLLLAYGSDFFIRGAVDIARYMKVSELIIGLTLAAIGTSLPELASSLAAIRHRQNDLLVGNIIGSNLFNILMVLGCGAIVRPYALAPQLLFRDLPVTFLFSAVLVPIMIARRNLSRPYGLALLLSYALYLLLLI